MKEDKILVTQSSMPPYEEYIEMIKPLWESHWLTNMGKYHVELENQLCNFLNVASVSLVTNGHMALEMALQSLNLPQGGEVITTPFTFISTTHAIIRNGLVPVFCDIKPDDFTIDENKIEDLITEKTVAILPVHVYGNICNIEKIQEITYKYDLKLVYDAAHAFGEKYKGTGIANFGDISTFSFHATKVFNTIEGGAICSNNQDVYEKVYNLKNFGIRSEELIVSVGANAKLNEFQAAMGLCNLKYLDNEILKRKKCVEYYRELLKDVEEIKLIDVCKNVESNYAYMPILCKNNDLRENIYNTLKDYNIFSRKYFYPITSDAACFKNKYKNLELYQARDCSKRILVLPLYADLQYDVIEKIVLYIKKCLIRKV